MDRSRLWIDRMEGYGGPTDRTGMDLRYRSDIVNDLRYRSEYSKILINLGISSETHRYQNRFCEKIKFILCQNKVK